MHCVRPIRILRGKGARARTVGLDPGAMTTVLRWTEARAAAGIHRGPLFCTLAGTEAVTEAPQRRPVPAEGAGIRPVDRREVGTDRRAGRLRLPLNPQ